MKARIGMYRILSLDLTVRKSVDNKCLNQTDSYNSSKLADALMLSTVNTLIHERNVFYLPGSDGSPVLFSKSVEEQIKGTVVCEFKLLKDPTVELHSSINDPIAKALIEEVGASSKVWQSGAVLCYKERGQNSLYACLTLNKNHVPQHTTQYHHHTTPYHTITKQSTPHTTIPSKTIEWTVRPLSGFIFLIWVSFMLFSPVVFCLFSPTHVYSGDQNTSLIVLEGPSHVSIRGWISNIKVSSNIASTESKLLISFVIGSTVVLSLLLGFIYFYFIQIPQYLDIHIIDSTTDAIVVTLVWGLLWGIRWLISVLFTRLSFENSCFVCNYVKNIRTIHQMSEPVEGIKQHLLIQRLIIMKCWNLLRSDCEMRSDKLRCRSWLLTICQFVGLVTGLLWLLVKYLVLYLLLGFCSCPMTTIIDLFVQEHIRIVENRWKKCIRIISLTVWLIFSYAAGGSFFLFTLASLFIKTLTKMLSPENIPHVTLAVLSVFYCSRRYNALKRKYDDLAAILYSHLKKRVKADGKIDNQHALNLEYNKKKAIPKHLFDKACQEIMPLGENIEKLVLSIFIILFLSFLVFMIIMKTPGVPDRMKITTMFLVAVMPMIVEIVVLKKGDKTKELEQEELDEKIQSIVDEYIIENPTREADPCDHDSDSPGSFGISECNLMVEIR